MNGDGIPDLIVANSGGNNVLVYPGLGNGQFGPPINGTTGFPVGTDPTGLAVANLERPARPAGRRHRLQRRLGAAGSGQRVELDDDSGARVQTDAGPVALAVGNLLGGTQIDLAVANSGADNVQIFPSVGGGFFNDQSQATKTYAVGQAPSSLFLGNFNGLGQGLATLNAGLERRHLDLQPRLGQPGDPDLPDRRRFADVRASRATSPATASPTWWWATTATAICALLTGRVRTGCRCLRPCQPRAPSPTSLSFAGVSDGLLSFYVSTAGREAAMNLAFNLEGGAGEAGSSPSGVTPTEGSSQTAC